jgi:hypothetical protein
MSVKLEIAQNKSYFNLHDVDWYHRKLYDLCPEQIKKVPKFWENLKFRKKFKNSLIVFYLSNGHSHSYSQRNLISVDTLTYKER